MRGSRSWLQRDKSSAMDWRFWVWVRRKRCKESSVDMIRSASKPAWRRPPHSRRKGRGGTVLGIFIGLIVGLGLAATVAFYLGRTSFGTPIPSMIAKEAPRSSKADSPSANATPDKPRFDFYKILPGGEEPKVGAMKSDRPNDATRLETAPKT